MDPIEEISRALCVLDGQDPDEGAEGGKPLWLLYRPEARTALLVLRTRALDQVAAKGYPALREFVDQILPPPGP